MTIKDMIMLVVGAAVLVALPIAMIWTIVDHVSHPRGERRGGSTGAALGAALQELDKLVARPSIEFVEEAETKIVKEEADPAGPPFA